MPRGEKSGIYEYTIAYYNFWEKILKNLRVIGKQHGTRAASPLEPGYSRPKEFFPPTGIVY